MDELQKKRLDKLQERMDLQFKDLELLKHALTHSSYVNENKLPLEKSNERLEFLGDAVLGLCMAEMLVSSFPEEPEGALSKRRAALVNQKQLARLAELLDLGSALLLGKGEEKTGGRTKASLLGDAFEAVIGAIYLDLGMDAARKYLRKTFAELLPDSKKVETSQDYKTRLQEYHQRRFKRSPKYHVIKESGPDHSKTFEVKIDFGGKILGVGKGRSKRDAEQDAAKAAFEALNISEASMNTPKKSKKRKESDENKSGRANS